MEITDKHFITKGEHVLMMEEVYYYSCPNCGTPIDLIISDKYNPASKCWNCKTNLTWDVSK